MGLGLLDDRKTIPCCNPPNTSLSYHNSYPKPTCLLISVEFQRHCQTLPGGRPRQGYPRIVSVCCDEAFVHDHLDDLCTQSDAAIGHRNCDHDTFDAACRVGNPRIHQLVIVRGSWEACHFLSTPNPPTALLLCVQASTSHSQWHSKQQILICSLKSDLSKP